MSGRVWIGILFLLSGLGIFLYQTEMIDFPRLIFNWWPLILIIIGVSQFVNRKDSSTGSGLLFLLIGLLFLINQWIDVDLTAYLWPLIFIIIGIVIIFTRVKREKTFHTEDDLDTFVLLSSAQINSRPLTFQGGNVTAILGGAVIDLRDATIIDGSSLDLMTVLGGIEIIVPDHIQVDLSGFPILGGWEDRTRVNQDEKVSVLKINCLTILGGVEIRN